MALVDADSFIINQNPPRPGGSVSDKVCPSTMTRISSSVVAFAVLSLFYGHSSAQIDAQSPLKDVDRAADKPSRQFDSPGEDASIVIFNNPKRPCYSDPNIPEVKVSIPVDTCVSANFTLGRNVRVDGSGLCPGGRKLPYIAVFNQAGCTGSLYHPEWYGTEPLNRCLIPELWTMQSVKIHENKWSMVFSCTEPLFGSFKPLPQPDKSMDISLPQPKPKDGPSRPAFASVSDSTCNAIVRGEPAFVYQKPEPDMCVNIAEHRLLSIYRNALCPNGTEALLARFNGPDCKGEPFSLEKADLSDDSNIPCLAVAENRNEAASYAFWCSGDLKRGEEVRETGLSRDDGSTAVHYEMSWDRKIIVENWDEDE